MRAWRSLALLGALLLATPTAHADPSEAPPQCQLGISGSVSAKYLVTAKGTLRDASGTEIPGVSVKVSFGKSQATATTDASGKYTAKIQAKRPKKSGKHDLKASFSDSATAMQCSAATKVYLKGDTATKTTLSVAPTKVDQGGIVAVDGKLTADGKGLAEATLTIKGSWGGTAQVFTNSAGAFSGYLGVPAKAKLGRATIRVSFAGESGLTASSRTRSLTVVKPKPAKETSPEPSPSASATPSAMAEPTPTVTPAAQTTQPEKPSGLPFGLILGVTALGALGLVLALIALGIRFEWGQTTGAKDVDKLIE